MRSLTLIDDSDIQVAQTLVERMKDHPFVQSRIERNVQATSLVVTRSDMWHSLIMCLLTTQNKSGFGSSVDTFLRQEPSPLALNTCKEDASPDRLIEQVLSTLGIRRWKISAGLAANNLRVLEEGGWDLLDTWIKCLFEQRTCPLDFDHFHLEREAAWVVQTSLKGLGPKQSRNFWQDLGLFRYEIPIDSRILKWFNNNLNFYIPVSSLSDERFYSQVMDTIRELCQRADLLPCLLDASIFASYEDRMV